ncbi:putative inactive receptor kinase [Sesamum alatum]|uniref:Inactive receptor kinase n=1 Tax=Sesamum alatum TaxID=300844 RepID=A0AAE1YJU1_9LAMI|nr:putative inactive receptor kinase [Sesamum alatum]
MGAGDPCLREVCISQWYPAQARHSNVQFLEKQRRSLLIPGDIIEKRLLCGGFFCFLPKQRGLNELYTVRINLSLLLLTILQRKFSYCKVTLINYRTISIQKEKMSTNYDNWERLVAAVLRKEQLWQLFHAQSRSPNVQSEASDISSSVHSRSVPQDVNLGFSKPASPSTYRQQIENGVVKLLIPVPKLVLVSGFPPAFDVRDVVLSSAEFLGSGTFGSTFVAPIENRVKIVVKRLKPMNISVAAFKRQMEIVGNVRHENVAALRTYYFSKGERFMLYDYYGKGSVFALLHRQTGENPDHVDWATRLRIAIELGMANMPAITFTPTARCYAPEVKNTQTMSQASDVYSFGILLLELLTRKSPVHVPGGPEAVDLVKLVSSVKGKDTTTKVFDVDLLKYPTIREQMVKVLQMGISCVAKSLKRRPKMSEVVKMLEDISIIKHRNSVFLASGSELVFCLQMKSYI